MKSVVVLIALGLFVTVSSIPPWKQGGGLPSWGQGRLRRAEAPQAAALAEADGGTAGEARDPLQRWFNWRRFIQLLRQMQNRAQAQQQDAATEKQKDAPQEQQGSAAEDQQEQQQETAAEDQQEQQQETAAEDQQEQQQGTAAEDQQEEQVDDPVAAAIGKRR